MPSITSVLIETEDGSHSLYVPELKEQYHSRHGAIQESKHVFIEAGLAQLRHLPEVSIFEVGFGTGLNALLAYEYADRHQQKINYTAIEAFPISIELAGQLNFPELINKNLLEDFIAMHRQPFNESANYSNYFTLKKIKATLQDFASSLELPASISSHLIFFDAFAPEVQPELWTPEIFQKMYDILLPPGILVTYCSKGQVRRNMQSAGFKVEKLPGPKGKREMIRAVKQVD